MCEARRQGFRDLVETLKGACLFCADFPDASDKLGPAIHMEFLKVTSRPVVAVGWSK